MGYTNPNVLVSTEWVEENLSDAGVVIVEVDVDTSAYDEGHIPGAVGWNWKTQLSDTLQRDILSREDMQALLQMSGIDKEQTVVLYGDNNNWFAAWAFWQMKLYRFNDVRIMDGGRKKWISEGRELTTLKHTPERSSIVLENVNSEYRSMLFELQEQYQSSDVVLVDVRSADEFTGKILAPPGLPETCQRGGHIPGAQNIGWGEACNEDGTFKSAEELRALYERQGITADKRVVTYCRIGERSSHSWFVLKYLLGYADVRNYDGSWTEWGNLVGAPVEK